MNAWWALGAVVMALLVWPPSARSERPFFTPRGASVNEGDPLSVAYAMDLLALALAGGAPGIVAVEAVAEACDETAEARSGGGVAGAWGSSSTRSDGVGALSRVAAAMRWGVDERSAWAAAPPVWRPVASAFELSARCGAAPSGLLRQAAKDLRAAEGERLATASARAGVRVVLPLGLCFLPAFVLLTIVPMVLGLVRLPS